MTFVSLHAEVRDRDMVDPYFSRDGVTIYHGDARDVLPSLDEGIVQCCVTSPPYFGLRDYGDDRQIGLEDTVREYTEALTDVFRQVRRVMKDDGTTWLNLGDSYAGSSGKGWRPGNQEMNRGGASNKNGIGNVPGVKPKDLVGIPWAMAFALRDDGWYLRQDIIWHKTQPMPESVRDRCTKAHEYVFLMAKSQKYYYDADAIAEDSVDPESHKGMKRRGPDKFVEEDGGTFSRTRVGFEKMGGKKYPKRNKRSVWTISSDYFHGAHFATFPRALARTCIMAGSPEGGVVMDPFFGSGTTGVVAQDAGRRCIGIELNEKYCEIAAKRFEQMSLFPVDEL